MYMRGIFLAVATMLIWSVTFVNTRSLLNGFTSYEILLLRFLVAYVALWIIHPRRYRAKSVKEELHFAAMGLSGVAAYQYLENLAIGQTNASNVAILVAACPMCTAVLSFLWLRERAPDWRFCAGFLLAISGVAIVCLGGIDAFSFRPSGDVLALLAMISWSVYSVLITRTNGHGYSPILAIRRTFFWALVFMLPALPFAFDFSPAVNLQRFSSPLNLFNLAFLGLFASALAFVLWNLACKALGTVRATCVLYFIPAVTALVAYFALGESLTMLTGLGAVLIVAGVVIGDRSQLQKRESI